MVRGEVKENHCALVTTIVEFNRKIILFVQAHGPLCRWSTNGACLRFECMKNKVDVEEVPNEISDNKEKGASK